eukprot:scaffold27097_cov13-Tisochrysis_lutea.AAC.1
MHCVSPRVGVTNRRAIERMFQLVRAPLLRPTQVVTVDMMDSLIGYEIPVKFLEVDESSYIPVKQPSPHPHVPALHSQERERLVFSNKRASMAQGAELQGYKVSKGKISHTFNARLPLGHGCTHARASCYPHAEIASNLNVTY